MNADFRGPLQCIPRSIDIFRTRPRQTANRRSLDFLCDPTHRFKIPRRAIGKSCLNDIDPQPRELLCHHDFLFHVHAGPRRLLAVSERRIKDSNHTCHTLTPSSFQTAQNDRPARPQVQKTPQAYPLRYVEDVFKPRTKLAVVFSSLKKNKSLHPYAQGRRLKKLRGTTLI